MNSYTLHYGDHYSLILLLSIILTILLQCVVVQSMYILPHFYLQWTCTIIDLIWCLIVWLLLLSFPFVSQGFTAFLGITLFCAVGIMWPCTLTQKMADEFLKCSSIAPVDTPPLHCLTAPVLDTTGTIRCSFWHFAGRGIAEMDACMSMRPVHMCQSVLVVLGVVVHVWNRCRLQSAWYEFFSAYNAQKIILNPVVFDPCWRCRSNSKDQSHRLVYQLDLASS